VEACPVFAVRVQCLIAELTADDMMIVIRGFRRDLLGRARRGLCPYSVLLLVDVTQAG
jgi:hypothetical protein